MDLSVPRLAGIPRESSQARPELVHPDTKLPRHPRAQPSPRFLMRPLYTPFQATSTICTPLTSPGKPGPISLQHRKGAHNLVPDVVTASLQRGASSTCTGAMDGRREKTMVINVKCKTQEVVVPAHTHTHITLHTHTHAYTHTPKTKSHTKIVFIIQFSVRKMYNQ
jgi:hypothetical protein